MPSPIPQRLGTSPDVGPPTIPIHQYLRGNVGMSIAEANLAREIVDRRREDLARIDEQIDDLRQRRERLVESLDDHAALLAPIRRLPPEILSEIFFHVMPTMLTVDSRMAPVLGQVCAYWRHVFFSSPKLWARIRVPLYEMACTLLTKSWLARSGQCPLHLTLNAHPAWPNGDVDLDMADRLQQTLDMIKGDASRLATLYFYSPNVHYFQAFRIFTEHPPSLYAIETVVGDFLDGSDLFNFLACCPHLRQLSIMYDSRSKLSQGLVPALEHCLPWHQLTRFCVSQCDLRDFAFILTHCPNLQHCVVGRHASPDDIPSIHDDGQQQLLQYPPIYHSTLTHLQVDVVRGRRFDVFSHSTLPNLRTLMIVNTTDSPDLGLSQSIIAFLKRSQCRLECFSLPALYCSSVMSNRRLRYERLKNLPELLQHMPSLNELDTSQHTTTTFNRSVILALTRGGVPDFDTRFQEEVSIDVLGHDSLAMLPNLRVLTLACRHIYEEPAIVRYWEERLVSMISSRFRPGSREPSSGSTDGHLLYLEHVTLHFDCMPFLATVEQLKKLSGEGLWVTLFLENDVISLDHCIAHD